MERIVGMIAVALTAGLLAAAPASAAAPAPAGPAADLTHFTALEEAWLGALARHDVPTLERLLAPEFVDTMWNGRLRNRKAVLAAARRHGLANGRQTLQDIAIRRYGRVAVVTGLDVSARGSVRFTDVFVRRHGRWQAARAQETPLR